jgi:quinol monooxygenase YgiN
MILFMLKLEPSPLQRKKLLGLMLTIAGPTSAQTGCLSCQVYDGAGEDATVLLVEKWNKEEDFHAHVRSPIYSRVLVAMDLSEKPPEVCCLLIQKTWGMELIRHIRESPGAEVS